jgi:aryl-alcohol dehydrogenase-like predicted oxidoreductase
MPSGQAEDEYRRRSPRFQGENFQKNLTRVARIIALAEKRGCTPAQLALAWALSRGEGVVTIPGTRHRKYLMDNLGAIQVILAQEETGRLKRPRRRTHSEGKGASQAAMPLCVY